uniref:Gypsy retrotransposon integrase-like protein 1 n=1 Tax=Cyprinus carpio TaxID=7962 RepID=A0A8C1KT19_CYPCA
MSRTSKRGGPKAPPVQQEEEKGEEEQDMVEGAGGGEAMGDRDVSVTELAKLLRTHMARTEGRETARQQEQVDQERRFKALQHQFGLLQIEVQARTSPNLHLPDVDRESRERPDVDHLDSDGNSEAAVHQQSFNQAGNNIGPPLSQIPRLEKLSDTDEVEHFLVTFERIAVACRWTKTDWVWHLIPLLTGKARAAYVHMDVNESIDYDKVKDAILKKYDVNAETYRQKFRSLSVDPSESPIELYNRLKELFGKWIQPKRKRVEEVSEILILEQYLRMLSPELQVWIRERDPRTAAEAASLADVFVAARGKSKPWAWKPVNDRRSLDMTHFQQRKSEGFGKPYMRNPTSAKLNFAPKRPPICYLCGQEGHTKPNCPKISAQLTQLCFVPRREGTKSPSSLKTTNVEINGEKLTALIDTGSDQTLVRRKFISPSLISTVKKLPICCVHGDERLLPTANVYVKIEEQIYLVEVGVADNLSFPVILGRDIPVLLELLYPARQCNVVVTRAKANQSEGIEHTLGTLPFFDAEIETGVSKRRKSRREKRQEKVKYAAHTEREDLACDLPVNFPMPTNIVQMQQEDASLTECFARAAEVREKPIDDNTARYGITKGILYREIRDQKQLVVPQCVREMVLHLSHSIPWAGHLGKNKTTARIKKWFFWPGLKVDVARFCKSCPVCQKVSLRRPSKAPLQPLPVIDTPFERLGMDVVGPVERSRSGNRFMLVITDYSTRYPEMRERLQRMTGLAQNHLAEARGKQKTWYDPLARERDLEVGTKVLVMLPSRESKLLAKWQGPYEIKKRLGPTTYEISMPGQDRSSRVLHVNLLKEWVPRPEKAQSLMIRCVEEEESDEQYLPQPVPGEIGLDHLTASQQSQVQVLFTSKVFSEYPGFTNLIEHGVILKPDAVVKRQSYRIPERLQVPLQEEVDLMLRLGIIEPSNSEWCHPIVLVPKKDGSIRFCIDIRYLNSVSQFDSYPTPRISDLIDRLGQSKYLTTMDLSKGYWQIPLTSPSRPLTAFRTPRGLFHFKVLPFGLHGAVATFQRLIDQVLRGLPFAAAYLDDIVIYSNTWEEHVQHLAEVLQRLQNAGLTVNPTKCAIAKQETEYLGYVIGQGVVRPQVKKVQALEGCAVPQTRKDMRSFLGMAGFYHRFVPNFSSRAAPLTDMVGARCPNQLQWTEERLKAFRDIQGALATSAVLHNPDFSRPFIVQTDASERGVGAVLLQGPPESRQPVAYISRKLFPREVRYSTVEKECLAIKWALDSLRYYLLGREFTLETDHKALQWLEKMKDSNGRITRWYLAMQPFRFKIQHVSGKVNVIADYLSRSTGEIPEGGGNVTARVVAAQER